MGNTQKSITTVDPVFGREVESNANGALARIFRRLTYKLNYAKKLRAICKAAQTRDKMYRSEINSPVFDEKLEYRLYQMATAPKMTFDSLIKLISHLFNVVEFKFKVSIKIKGTDKWIDIEQNVFNTTGPITDINTLDQEDIDLIKESIEGVTNERKTIKNNK